MDQAHTDRDRPTPTIGIVGVGLMGEPIARALGSTFIVAAFDIDPERAVIAPNLEWKASVGELALAADVLVTVLPGPGELSSTMTTALPLLRRGALWLDLTSGDPAASRDLAARASVLGVDMVSAPMGGSVAEASNRELTFFVSGDDRAVARAMPVLAQLSRPDGVRRSGSRAEDGQIVKLLANSLWFANALAASEAMLIGQGLGLAPADLHRLLRDSAGGSRYLDAHAERLLDGDYLTTFGIDRVVEELRAVAAMGRATRTPTPMLDVSESMHEAALRRFGPELGELLAVKVLEEDAGRDLRR